MRFLSFVSILFGGGLALACPAGQHSQCVIPRPFGGGCAQSICVWDEVPPVVVEVPQSVDDVWGEAGRIGYQQAAQIMSVRNRNVTALTPHQVDVLNRTHADRGHLQSIRVHYNSIPLDSWSYNGLVINQGSDGQTFGDDVYISGSVNESDCGQIALLAHEITHSVQARRVGGLGEFGFNYFREYSKAGRSYENNSMEVEARNIQDIAYQRCN